MFCSRLCLLVVIVVARLHAAGDPILEFSRLDLTDGRSLRNVVIKTYDAKADKVLLVADGKAMSIPRSLVPPPFAEQLRQVRRSGEFVSTIKAPPAPIVAAAQQYHMSRAVFDQQVGTRTPVTAMPVPAPPLYANPAPRSSVRPPGTLNQALAQSQSIDLGAHRNVALERAQRYYRYEFRAGSDSVIMTGVQIELSVPTVVPGWEGRCRAEGKAYLEIFDSRGRSFQRRTSTFEVVTERKSTDDQITVIDFSPKT